LITPLRPSRVRYRLAQARAARLLELLDAKAEMVDVEGHTDEVFELSGDGAPSRARVTLRFTIGQEFGELEIVTGEGPHTSASVYAAGPIERILLGLGFVRVGRGFVIGRCYRVQEARVTIAHTSDVGWSCEIASRDARDLGSVLGFIADAERSAAFDSAAPSEDRRRAERRIGDRRKRVRVDAPQRRASTDRRFGERRLSPTN